MTPPERIHPPIAAPELEMLTAWLEYHRATLLIKCQGLTPAQLCERAVPPSSMTLIGLVRHMAEVERGWFWGIHHRENAAGIYYSDDDPDGDFDNVAPETVEADFAVYETECAQARRVLAEYPDLDRPSDRIRRDHAMSLRWIMIHMIEEYARHNGHADFLRERIDGATGE